MLNLKRLALSTVFLLFLVFTFTAEARADTVTFTGLGTFTFHSTAGTPLQVTAVGSCMLVSMTLQCSDLFDGARLFSPSGNLLGSGPLLGGSTLLNLTAPETGFYTLTLAISFGPQGPRCTTCSATATVTGVTPTPEPTTMLLLATGLAGVAGRAFRRRRRS